MKRKIVGVSSAYLSGLFFSSFFINIYGFIILAAVSVIVVVIAKVRNFSRFDLYIIIFSFLAAVAVSMTYTLRNYCAITNFAGITGSFSGRVTDYEVYEGDRASYIISGIINGGQKANIIFYCYETGAEYGDIITLENCTFEEFESDYLFDTKTYYKSRYIFLRVNGAENIDINYTDSAKIKKMLASFRENMISRICCTIGSDSGGFLAGMIFGEKQYIDDNTKTSLYRSGIGHVLAVSGLHVSIIASIIMWIMNKLKVNKFIRFGIINLLFLFFIALVNYPVSAIRAVIMLDIMYSAPLFRRQNDSLNSIAVAALLISIAKPYSIYDSGFILSISGTFGIAVFGRYMAEKTDEKFTSALVIGICTTLSVMPISMYYFDETSLVSPFANILLIPFCTLAMISGLLYVFTGGIFNFLLYIADIFIKLVIYISNAVSSVDFLYISRMNGIFPALFMLSGFIIVCLFLFRESRRITAISIAVSIVICSCTLVVYGKSRDKSMIIAVLGNGNNSAVAVLHNGRTDIIDLSGHYRSAKYVRKYLSENGRCTVDTLLLTKNTASQDIIYETELMPFRTNRRFTSKYTDICSGRLKLLENSEFSYDSGNYSISYNDNILSVCYGECKVNFSPAKDNIHNDGLNIYYGSINKNTQIYSSSIYLDDINNFEIILSADGKYMIRRLYGET